MVSVWVAKLVRARVVMKACLVAGSMVFERVVLLDVSLVAVKALSPDSSLVGVKVLLTVYCRVEKMV